jgi:N-acetylglucosaminyldiphosphoundecaprenol N-acetyl-beta-D-mannosaminyltransferase
VESRRTRRLPVIELAGVQLHSITEAQAIAHIMGELEDGHGGVVVTPNLDHLRRCTRDLQFHAMVAEADLAVADGMPLIWASRIQGTPLPERVAGSNLISTLNAAAAERGKRIFLLGGSPGAAEGAAKVLRERHPGVQVFCHVPPFGFEKNPRQWAEMEKALLDAQPDIVWVAMGAPKQEQTIYKLREALPRVWWLGVGNSLSFLAGHVRRAPRWMQKIGLEWVHRLWQEPSKLWKRYLVVGLPFGFRLLAGAALRAVPTRVNRWRYGTPQIEPFDAPAVNVPPATNGTPHDAPSANGNGHSYKARRDAANEHPEADLGIETATLPEEETPTATPQSRNINIIRSATAGKSADQIFRRLRALILLGGSVRPSPLSAATGRSVLDLPLDENGSILNYWLAQGAEMARLAGLEKLPVRVLVNHASREPVSAGEQYFGTFRVEKDLSEYRGTGGVLRDVAADYQDDDYILVANACQILLDPLPAIAAALAKQGGDVNLVAHDDGTPSGVQLLACKTVRLIGHNGYHDMKEQALPKIAAEFAVRAMRRRRPTGLPIRTLENYVEGLRLYHRRKNGKPVIVDPLAEDWSPSFSLVEAGAKVHPGARIHDSVVLSGATVDAGAVVVRSLVCGEAEIRTERTVVDQYVTAAPKHIPPMPVAAAW